VDIEAIAAKKSATSPSLGAVSIEYKSQDTRAPPRTRFPNIVLAGSQSRKRQSLIPPEKTPLYGLYQECGWHARVLILADHSDAEFERYTLEVIKGSTHIPSLRAGSRFGYARRRGVMSFGMAHLTIDEDDEESAKG
jgi:hypothetical protein